MRVPLTYNFFSKNNINSHFTCSNANTQNNAKISRLLQIIVSCSPHLVGILQESRDNQTTLATMNRPVFCLCDILSANQDFHIILLRIYHSA